MEPQAQPRARAALVAWLLALAPGLASAAVEGLGATATLQLNRFETADTASDAVNQRYYLFFENPLSGLLKYRAKLGYIEDHANVFTEGPRLGQRAVQPGLQLDYGRDWLSLNGLYEYQWIERFSQVAESVAGTNHRGSTTLGIQATEALRFAARFEWHGQREASTDVRLDRYRADASGTWQRGVNSVSLGPVLDVYKNSATGYLRTTISPTVKATYGGTWLGGRLNVNLNGAAVYSQIDESAGGALPVSEPRELEPLSAYYVVSSTPADTTATPSTSVPALIDGNYVASTGISLGPDGVSSQNLAFDMGRVITLDEFRVYLRDPAGNPLQEGGPVTWTAYTSLDGLRWTPTSSAGSRFDLGLSAWVIAFTPTEARHFKVVNFGVSRLPTLVTEMEIYEHRTILPNETRTSWTATQVVGGGVTLQITEKLTATVTGTLGANQQRPAGRAPYDSITDNYLVGLSAGPWAGFTFSGSYAHNDFTRTLSPTLRGDLGSLGVGFVPNELVSTGLTASAQRQDYGDFRLESQGLSLTAGLNPIRKLNIGAYAAVNWSVNYPYGLEQTVMSAGGSAVILMHRTFDVTLAATAQKILSGEADLIPEGVPIVPPAIQRSYSATLRYHPNSQLDLSAQFGYTETGAADGPVQNYRVNWLPFPNGAFSLILNYQQNVEPISGSSLSRLSVIPGWSISKHLSLTASVFRQWGSGPFAVPLETYYLALTFYL